MRQHVGIPKEIKNNEQRVSLTPTACANLIHQGIRIHIESGAGDASYFPDTIYERVGCKIYPTASELYEDANIILKIQPPEKQEFLYLKEQHTLFCYLHLDDNPVLHSTLEKIGLTAIAFEALENEHDFPLVSPISALTGRLAVQMGAYHLQIPFGGAGTLLGGTSKNPKGRVTIVGAGSAGTEAALLALAMGSKVTILDIHPKRLQMLKHHLPALETLPSTPENLAAVLPRTNLLIGAARTKGQNAPKVITEENIRSMSPGSVVVDTSIDEGGCVETSKPTSFEQPSTTIHNVLHIAIPNMTTSVPRTATEILSDSLFPYIEQIANKNMGGTLKEAIKLKGQT